MIKNSSRQTGSTHIVIIIVLVVALIGALGFVFWQNFMRSPATTNNTQTNQGNGSEEPARLCANVGDAVERDGVFCSESIGVEFKVPEAFVGKIQKKENYDISKGEMESPEGSPAGKSLEYYEAVVSSGKETLTLSIAKEPLRSGYSSIGHALQRTYFNATTRNLYLVNGPTREYDSASDTTKVTGGWSEGESVPSFNVSDTKIYKGQIGDAGVIENGYLMVVNDSIVVIKIKHATNPMNDPVLDYKKQFTDLDNSLKLLKVL